MKTDKVMVTSARDCFHSQHQFFRMILYLHVWVAVEVSNDWSVTAAMAAHLLINQLLVCNLS